MKLLTILGRTLPMAALLAAGCSGVPSETPGDSGAAAAQEPKTLSLAGSGDQGTLAIFHGGSSVHVGDSWNTARAAFPQPKGAYEMHDLPNRIPSKFEAHGWELPSGEGYGVITSSDGKTVLAMYQLEHVKQDTVQDFIRDQEDELGSPARTVSGRTLTYYFWFDKPNDQTLMISELTTPTGINMTIALGDDNVLAALGISYADGQKAVKRIDGTSSAISTPSLLR